LGLFPLTMLADGVGAVLQAGIAVEHGGTGLQMFLLLWGKGIQAIGRPLD
jgi:hypothetical protein